ANHCHCLWAFHACSPSAASNVLWLMRSSVEGSAVGAIAYLCGARARLGLREDELQFERCVISDRQHHCRLWARDAVVRERDVRGADDDHVAIGVLALQLD